jgi:hypothetical protein
MKNKFLLTTFVSLFTVVALCSCNKDDDENIPTSKIENNTITAKVEDGVEIDLVKAMILDNYEIARADYLAEGFTLELPKTVDDRYLESVSNLIEISDVLQISNPDVKAKMVHLITFKSNKMTSVLVHGTQSYIGMLVYVNGDVNITGSGTDENGVSHTYNVHLTKGWNIMYMKIISISEIEITTQSPADAVWFCDEDLESFGIYSDEEEEKEEEDSGEEEDEEEEEEEPLQTIVATVENGSDYNGEIDFVKAFMSDNEIAKGEYTNGGFTLKLPETVNDKYLSDRIFGEDFESYGVFINNFDVKGRILDIVAFKSDKKVGAFSYGTPAQNYGVPVYVTDNLYVSGSGIDKNGVSYTYDNILLDKGWNMVYSKVVDSKKVTVTTQPPTDPVWFYEKE